MRRHDSAPPAGDDDSGQAVGTGDVRRLKRRVAELEQQLAEWVDRYESSPIPMTVEDWSGARRIVDRLRGAGIDSIVDHVRENPGILAELAPAVRILDVNPACVRVYRAPDRETLLAHFNQPPDLSTYNPDTGLSDIFVGLVQRFADGATRIELEGPDSALDGTRLYIRTTTSIARGREHDWGSVLQTVEDFTRREAAEAELRRLAVTDALTGLANRHHYLVRLGEAVRAARRSAEVVALLYLDLDGFKQVNDAQGHAAGDRLLRDVAERLRAVCREVDCLARIGGDEFAVVLSGTRETALVERPAERIIEALGQPFTVGDAAVRLGVSVGAARFPLEADEEETLRHRADEALYRAKRAGGSRLCLWRAPRG